MAIFLEMRAVGPGLYDVLHGGEILCRSREPFLAGCRCLLASGHAPTTVVEIRHEGQPGYSLRGRLGRAAGLTVDEHNGTVFAKWKAFPRSSVASPSDFSGSPLSGIGSDEKRTSEALATEPPP